MSRDVHRPSICLADCGHNIQLDSNWWHFGGQGSKVTVTLYDMMLALCTSETVVFLRCDDWNKSCKPSAHPKLPMCVCMLTYECKCMKRWAAVSQFNLSENISVSEDYCRPWGRIQQFTTYTSVREEHCKKIIHYMVDLLWGQSVFTFIVFYFFLHVWFSWLFSRGRLRATQSDSGWVLSMHVPGSVSLNSLVGYK